jgi:hypothetical protein
LVAQVTTLQQHLAQLTLEVLQERTGRFEQRLKRLEALVPQPVGPLPASLPSAQVSLPPLTPPLERRPHPAERGTRYRLTPLIEYGKAGHYVTVCPKDGVLALTPDSEEWFAWLASLQSFRFLGAGGRFTAYRSWKDGHYTRSWLARRWMRGQNCWQYLGITAHLTVATMEQVAAMLQARWDAR